jgi:hypothetical protein
MPAKKRKAKGKARPARKRMYKIVQAPAQRQEPVAVPVEPPVGKHAIPARVEQLVRQEDAAREFFAPRQMTFGSWARRYSPVLVTMLIALLTYFYLIFYLFYPTTIVQGHYVQLLILIVFIFLIIGLLVYLGLRAELLFIRILSFIFVFIVFTFLLLFVLIAHSMGAGAA